MGCKAPAPGASGGYGKAKGKGKGKFDSYSPWSGGGGGAQWQCSGCGFTNKASNEVCGGTGPMGCKAPQPSGGGQGKGWGSKGGKGGGKDDMLSMLMDMMGKSGGGGKGKSWGGKSQGGGKGFQQQGGTYKVDDSGGELGEFVGTIKSFGEAKNYGFIQCEDIVAAGYGDVFLHGDMKKGYQVGNKVKFTCILNKEGKPHAKDLKSGLK